MVEKNKKNNNSDQQKKSEPEKRKQDKPEPEKKKQDNNTNVVTVVLNADLHCEECVSKVLKCIRSFDGVENATVADGPRITVVGKVDPVKLRERVEKNTHKKVEIILPQTNTADGKGQKTKEIKGNNDKKSKEKKELPVTTAVLRTRLHCQGCTLKIVKLVSKSKGYREMKIDREKELVTVTGAMDMNALANLLKKHLKKEVEILQPKKENHEKKDSGGGEKGKAEKGKIVGGEDKGKAGGGGDKKKGDGGDGGEGEKVQVEVMKNKLIECHNNVGYYPCPIVYGSNDVVGPVQYRNPYAPQIFSDENPNACSVM